MVMTTISIFSDSPFERRGLQAALAEEGWNVSEDIAPSHMGEGEPAIALVSCQDAAMREKFLAQLAGLNGVKTLALVPSTTQADLWNCLQGGADSVLTRDAEMSVLLGTLKLLEQGQRVLPCEMRILGSTAVKPKEAAGLKRLSIREREVLTLVMQGLANKVIARHLNLTEATVKVHLKAILRKLDVQNRTKAAIVAFSHGLGEDDAGLEGDTLSQAA
jgi:two-component system nitrate/nitrite response regulator NarL